MSLSDPTLWGQLPFDLLSKILKVEKDRLDEVAMDEWKLSIKDLNHEFQGVVSQCYCARRGRTPSTVWSACFLSRSRGDPLLRPGFRR
jgi:hypothetical protein